MMTKLEDHILMTVWKFQGEAYGVNIYQHLVKIMDSQMAIGVVYFALDRLTKRGFLRSYKGEPTAVRGGMRKKYYQITKKGIDELEKSKSIHDKVWEGYKGLATDSGR